MSQEAHDLEVGRLRAIASCERWEKLFTPKEKIEWLIDPPFGITRYVQLWQVVVSNLRPDDRAQAEDREGTTRETRPLSCRRNGMA